MGGARCLAMLKTLVITSLMSPSVGATSKEQVLDIQPITLSLIEAARGRNVDSVKRIVNSEKRNLEERDSRGRTALLIATHNDDLETAKVLIDAGADVNAQDEKLDSPLLYAGAEGRLQILRALLKANPNFKIYNRYGGTALIPACERGHVEVVKELLQTSIDINHKNKLGWTALLEAVILGTGGQKHQEIIRLLVAAGADKSIADNEGVTALEHARKRNLKEIVKILSE